MTFIQTLIETMAAEVMSASDIETKLIASNRAPESLNLRGYISSCLTATRTQEGLHVFHAVSRGQYRVATEQDQHVERALNALETAVQGLTKPQLRQLAKAISLHQPDFAGMIMMAHLGDA